MMLDSLNIKDYGLVAHLMIGGHKLEPNEFGGYAIISEKNKQFEEDCSEYFSFYKKRLDAIKRIKKQLSKS